MPAPRRRDIRASIIIESWDPTRMKNVEKIGAAHVLEVAETIDAC